jgi:hypothetical protein
MSLLLIPRGQNQYSVDIGGPIPAGGPGSRRADDSKRRDRAGKFMR